MLYSQHGTQDLVAPCNNCVAIGPHIASRQALGDFKWVSEMIDTSLVNIVRGPASETQSLMTLSQTRAMDTAAAAMTELELQHGVGNTEPRRKLPCKAFNVPSVRSMLDGRVIRGTKWNLCKGFCAAHPAAYEELRQLNQAERTSLKLAHEARNKMRANQIQARAHIRGRPAGRWTKRNQVAKLGDNDKEEEEEEQAEEGEEEEQEEEAKEDDEGQQPGHHGHSTCYFSSLMATLGSVYADLPDSVRTWWDAMLMDMRLSDSISVAEIAQLDTLASISVDSTHGAKQTMGGTGVGMSQAESEHDQAILTNCDVEVLQSLQHAHELKFGKNNRGRALSAVQMKHVYKEDSCLARYEHMGEVVKNDDGTDREVEQSWVLSRDGVQRV